MALALAPSRTPSFAGSAAEVNLAELGGAMRRRWRWIAIPTLLALLGSLAFVNLVSPRYTGEAKLLLQSADTYYTRNVVERSDQQPLIDDQAVASQVQVVMSRDLAREAIKRLGLVGNAEFDPLVSGLGTLQRLGVALGLIKDPLAAPPEDRVLEAYYDHLLVYPVGKSRIVSIEFRAKDAELAARAANTIAELYLAQQEDAKKDTARSASSWLGANIDDLRKRVATAEAKVEEFRSRTGLLLGSGTTTLSAQQLSELSTQLAQARTAQSDGQAKAKLIRDLLKDGRGFEIPDVANNELIRRVIEQRINLKAQLALELRTLMPAHPRIKELNAQLSDLDIQLRGAAERTARTLENDSRIAGARVEAINAAIDSQKKVVSQANEGEVQLRALEREARTQREQLETYLSRFREASARDAGNALPPDARIVSRAIAPQNPSFPKKLPTIGLVTFAMLMLTMGAVVAAELLRSRPGVPARLSGPDGEGGGRGDRSERRDRDSRREPELNFDLSHLRGRAPAAMADGEPAARPAASLPSLPDADARYDFERLIARLGRKPVEGRGRRILVTGVGASSEAQDVAAGLARALAGQDRALLIELDDDRPAAHAEALGLTDLVAGDASFAEVIHRDRAPGLDRISAGTLLNAALTADPDETGLVLRAFDQAYPWVVTTIAADADLALLRFFASRHDIVVIASNLEPANHDLVGVFEAAQDAGAPEVLVAREHTLPEPLAQAA